MTIPTVREVFEAVRLNDAVKVEKLITYESENGEDKVDVANLDNGQGSKPLHFAATYCAREVAHKLLEHNAQVDAQDEQGFTALHRLAYHNFQPQNDSLYDELLTQYNANPEIRDKIGRTPSELAAYRAEKIKEGIRFAEAQAAEWEERKARLQGVQAVEKIEAEPEAEPQFEPVPEGPRQQLAIMFPGQGAQEVGMMKDMLQSSIGTKILKDAEEVLGYDIGEIILNGPAEKLNDTEYSQPAIFTCSWIAFQWLKASNKDLFDMKTYEHTYAGLSLGEYTALVAANVLSFRDGLALVKERALAMKDAATQSSGGMMTVIGLEDDILDSICKAWVQKKPDLHCMSIANYLFPKCRVVSGDLKGLDFVDQQATTKGATKTIRTAVSGAFHSALMEHASDRLRAKLESCSFAKPNAHVHSNVSGCEYSSYNKQKIVDSLCKQLVNPVKWESSLRDLCKDPYTTHIELGPGRQITAMVRRINPKAAKEVIHVANTSAKLPTVVKQGSNVSTAITA